MILDELAECARQRTAEQKKIKPLEEVASRATKMPVRVGLSFEEAISVKGISFICEIKKASPSKGIIDKDYPFLQIARDYEEAGAAAISVLTEPSCFLGSGEHLREAAGAAGIPVLRKDFTVDEYQIFEAKLLGASAVLLICALLDTDTLSRFIEIAHRLSLVALCEAHSESEIKSAVAAGARVIGVNNRDLRDFSVDINTSARLREFVPENVLFVSESGIRTPADVKMLAACGADALLVGETLMRSTDKRAALAALRGG